MMQLVDSFEHEVFGMARRYNQFQTAFLLAKAEFESAEAAFNGELADSGIKEKLDADPSDFDIDALSAKIDAIAVRWRVSDLRKAMQAAETALIDWSLDLTLRLRPSSAEDVAALRLRIHIVKPGLIAAALRIPA
jgi:hypothetical protein